MNQPRTDDRAEARTPSMPELEGARIQADSMRLAASLLLAGCAFFVAVTGCSPPDTRKEAPTETPPDIPAIRHRAEQGDAAAQAEMGSLCAEGRWAKQDYAEAAKWYRRAAEQQHAGAQIALGELSEAGQGVPRDEAEAALWYRLAAEQGHASGQYNLAVLYTVGRGVPLDHGEAIKWYERAAEQGDVLAQYNLGMRYLEGNGVSVDRVAAWKWLTLAAERTAEGLEDARKARQVLASRITTSERSRAETQVREFRTRTRPSQNNPQ